MNNKKNSKKIDPFAFALQYDQPKTGKREKVKNTDQYYQEYPKAKDKKASNYYNRNENFKNPRNQDPYLETYNPKNTQNSHQNYFHESENQGYSNKANKQTNSQPYNYNLEITQSELPQKNDNKGYYQQNEIQAEKLKSANEKYIYNEENLNQFEVNQNNESKFSLILETLINNDYTDEALTKAKLDIENNNSDHDDQDKYREKVENIKVYSRFLSNIRDLLKISYLKKEDKQSLCEIYLREKKRFTSGLPIYSKKDQIISEIDKNIFTVIIGETGSGKSTQLSQYISDYNIMGRIKNPKLAKKKVLITQPRKLATKSLSIRVSQEMDYVVNTKVVCKVNFSDIKRDYNNAEIVYVIDRILVEELIKDPNLDEYSHIIIDEAHERNLYTDIILGLIKETTNKREDLKIIVTSATIDVDMFSKFFFNCPIIHIKGRVFPVKVKYTDFLLDSQESKHSEIIRRVSSIVEEAWENHSLWGHILIFTSGIDDINKLSYPLKNLNDKGCHVLQLHGKLSNEEQSEIFKEFGTDMKIILSTRIAETSLTINNVKYVIDIGYDKEPFYDVEKKINVYRENYITQSSANQRMGRAGRTTNGFCYRIYTKEEYENSMPKFKIPEILRSNLSTVILKLKQFNIKDVIKFEFIQRPDEIAIKNSIKELKLLGALNAIDESVTPLGFEMADLPTDPWISKIILEGARRNVQEDVIAIISVLNNCNNLFYKLKYNNPYKKSEELDDIKHKYSDETGDLITFLNIFNKIFGGCKNFKRQERDVEIRRICKENGFNIRSAIGIIEFYNEIKFSLNGKNLINTIRNFTKNQQLEEMNLKKEISNNPVKKEEIIQDVSNQKLTAKNMVDFYKNMTIKKDEVIKEVVDKNFNILIKIEANKEKIEVHTNNLKEKIKAKENLTDTGKIHEILKCFLSSYFQNICVYSNNEDIGYTLIREMINVNLDKSTSLVLNQNFTKWIFCLEITKSEKTKSKIASYCDIDWIKEVVPSSFLEYYNIINYDINPVYKELKCMRIPTVLIKSFEKPSINPVLNLESFLEENKLIVKGDLDRNILKIFTLADNYLNAKTVFEQKYKYLKSEFESSSRDLEYNSIYHLGCEKGLNIIEPLKKDEFRAFKIYVDSSYIKNIDELKRKFGNKDIKITHLNEFLLARQEANKKIYELMKSSLKSSVVDERIINEFIVKCKDKESAKLLYSKFNEFLLRYKKMFGQNFKFESKPCNMEIENLLKEGIININVNMYYCLGDSTGTGNISGCLEFLKKAKEKMDMDYKLEKTYIHTFGREKLNFKGLSPLNNEFDLLFILKPLYKQLRIEDIKIIRVIINKESKYKNPQSIIEFMDIMKNDHGIDLKDCVFEEKNRQDKFLSQVTCEDLYYKTFKRIHFNVNNNEVANTIKEKFDGIVGYFGDNKTEVSVLYKSTIIIEKEKMNSIRDKVIQLKKELTIQYRTVRIDIISNEKMSKDKINISSEKSLDEVINCRFSINDLIEGFLIPVFNYYQLLILFHRTSILNIKGVEKNFNVFIDKNDEKKEIRICGLASDVERAKIKILDLMNNTTNISKKLSYANKNISAFFINSKKLQYELRDKFCECTFYIDVKDKNFILYGKENKVEELEKEIISLIGKDILPNSLSIIKCFICGGEVINNYRMISCKKENCNFCKTCLVEYINNIEEFPIECSCCKELIVLKDFRDLIKEKKIKELVRKSFLNNYLPKNLDKFKLCNCKNILKNIEINCENCFNNQIKARTINRNLIINSNVPVNNNSNVPTNNNTNFANMYKFDNKLSYNLNFPFK